MKKSTVCCAWLLLIGCWSAAPAFGADADGRMTLHARSRVESPKQSGQFEAVDKTVPWDAKKTAVIVCDMWDRHWCQSATGRTGELAPRMNDFVVEARKRGALIVHAPSDCMASYKDHPARKRAQNTPNAGLPAFLRTTGGKLQSETAANWPLDQSDGGCDCTPICRQGSPWPWHRQIDLIKIGDEDAISDSGVEIGNLFAQRGIENVMLLGVHTNMCVIGRSFGLRNMVRLGKNVVLVRDLTDTMYNPRQPPRVNHFRGTDLIVEHIEKYVCPTIVSSDLLGGPAFRFRQDRRPHVVLVAYEDEYHAAETLPRFAQQLADRFGYKCSVLLGQPETGILGLDELATADVLVLFVRRHPLPKQQMALIRRYLDAGKPLVALRTASHAFSLSLGGKPPAAGLESWPTFDHDVLGGNYHDHYRAGPPTQVTAAPNGAEHPILAGIQLEHWTSTALLYKASPLAPGATGLLVGRFQEHSEPVAWTHDYHGGRVFYTSLGNVQDFQTPQFCTMLINAIHWAMDRPVPKQP